MKKFAILFIINSCLTVNAYSQTIYSTVKDVYSVKTLTFYGYDYSKLNIADETRIGQPLKKFFPNLTIFLDKKIPKNKMKGSFKKGAVIFNETPANLVNEKINNNNNIATVGPQTFPVDLLPSFINNYQIDEKEGIGYTIIFECFDRTAKTVSAYIVFFDIATKNVLLSHHAISFDRNGYNYMGDWKAASLFAVRKLFKMYSTEKKAFQKG